ncbi:Protein T14B4.5, partial [Aphelenchoides avenae]
HCGYSRSNRTVWHLLQLSIAFGALSGLTRCVQVRHRLYSAFHECFYAYFHFFMVGIVMTWRVTERFPCEQKTSVADEKKSQ